MGLIQPAARRAEEDTHSTERERGREKERERERERGREGDGMLQENDERVHSCMAAGEYPKDI